VTDIRLPVSSLPGAPLLGDADGHAGLRTSRVRVPKASRETKAMVLGGPEIRFRLGKSTRLHMEEPAHEMRPRILWILGATARRDRWAPLQHLYRHVVGGKICSAFAAKVEIVAAAMQQETIETRG